MFSQLDNLKKRLLLQIELAEDRIRESDGFNLLKERFQALPRRRRRLIKHCLFGLILLSAIGLPLSFLYSSSKRLGEFREKDRLSRALLRTGSPAAFPSYQKSAAEARKQLSALAQRHAGEEGGLNIKDLGDFKISKGEIKGKGGGSVRGRQMEMSVSRLNIKEAASLGERISRFRSLKIRKLRLKENPSYENHYDAVFSVVFFPPPVLKAVKNSPRSAGSFQERSKKAPALRAGGKSAISLRSTADKSAADKSAADKSAADKSAADKSAAPLGSDKKKGGR